MDRIFWAFISNSYVSYIGWIDKMQFSIMPKTKQPPNTGIRLIWIIVFLVGKVRNFSAISGGNLSYLLQSIIFWKNVFNLLFWRKKMHSLVKIENNAFEGKTQSSLEIKTRYTIASIVHTQFYVDISNFPYHNIWYALNQCYNSLLDSYHLHNTYMWPKYFIFLIDWIKVLYTWLRIDFMWSL